MTAIGDSDVAASTPCAARDARSLPITFMIVITAGLVCSFYASIEARGLYHDGVYYVFKIAARERFFLIDPARNVVQILRQAPIVLLSEFTEMSVFQLGQVFTFILLALPTLLCALCWVIVPRGRKAWILFPLVYLLTAFAATSMHAIGEAAIAASYFWILLFLFLFRTRSIGSQGLFLLLSVPAFQLHEGAFPFTSVMLLACAMRARVVTNMRERRFVGVCALLFAAILAYQIRWIIYPRFPTDRAEILQGLMQFQFLYVDGRLNLPLVTGTVALLALAAVFFVHTTLPPGKAASAARAIALFFALFALAAIAAAILVDESFSPLAQLQARYQPVFTAAALGMAAVVLLGLRLPDRLWMQPATIFIVIALCAAQTTADLAATRRWHAFVVDLQSRLATGRGLISWEKMRHTGNERADTNWRLMAVEWVIPVTSIVYSPNGSVRSIIDLPAGTSFRPVDPEKPDRLPPIRGVDYTPYRRFFASQKAETRSP